jgi:PilZ domain-containing protein
LTKEVNKSDKKSRRARERIHLALPARIDGRESGNREWSEMTRLINVTPFGAQFRLTRPTDPGRLLRLTLAMPRLLRVFDHVEDQYRVWAIVRNVRLLDPKKENGALVEIGVAFIGKHPPKSYAEDPLRRYEVKQTTLKAELWNAADESAPQLVEMPTDDKRRESRQLIPVEVLIEVFDENKLVKSESTVTENISHSGATVFTALEVEAGTFIRMSSEQYGATVLAVVRARRQGGDGITRLHLEFIGSEWPL